MVSSDDRFETIRILLDSGALSESDLSSGMLAVLKRTQVQQRIAATESAGQLDSKPAGPGLDVDSHEQVDKQNPSANPYEKSKAPKRPALSASAIRAGLTLSNAEELVRFKQLVDMGLARQQDFDFMIQELKKSERSFGPVFRREHPDWRRSPESVVHAKDMAIRLQNSSWVISGLGVIAGLILMFVSSQNFSGDATHPFLGSGLVLIASSIFFGFCVHAVGAFMEARLEQGESRLE